ncbi:uncharacterized protein LOC133194770 [Saccostrea echinata]|uniref:uncharacterized protein LOC133194770 n=1 Tax=Saccostrea echinata TaxID=191078 RepID=UPI002A8086F1|nr:uncharacterized protein LOC133194770 [Saccostrea echinata]
MENSTMADQQHTSHSEDGTQNRPQHESAEIRASGVSKESNLQNKEVGVHENRLSSEDNPHKDGEEDPQEGGSGESEDSSEGTVVTKVKYRTWQNTSSESWESGNPISPVEAEELEKEALGGPSQEEGTEDEASNSSLPRPESLNLPRPLQQYEKKRSRSDGVAIECYNHLANIPDKKDSEFENIEETMLSKSMPHGVVMKKGELFEFVADDLQEKIRQSSPLPKTESSGLSSRTSSSRSIASISSGNSSAMGTSMASEMSRSPSTHFQNSPIDIPPIDPMAVMELEMAAKRVADNVDLLMGNLKSNLHKMSAITVGCLDAYKKSVDATCDSVDSSIKSMYALMAKCEELSKSMQPVYQLANQIKEIKRLLDRFESQLSEKASKTKSG